MTDVNEDELRRSIEGHVEKGLSELHWLHDRILFIEAIPKNQSNKIMKFLLRSWPLKQ
jgi:acyl-coenzyme A synthetase/AMP-(fatty) acid ligase